MSNVKIESFYSNNGVVTIGYFNGQPYIAYNPILPNPTPNRRYDYSQERSIFHAFLKPLEIATLIDRLEYVLWARIGTNMQAGEVPNIKAGISRKYNKDKKQYMQDISVGRVLNGDYVRGYIYFEDREKNLSYYHEFKNDSLELKLIKRFFERALDNILSQNVSQNTVTPYDFETANNQQTQFANDTHLQRTNIPLVNKQQPVDYLRNNDEVVVKNNKVEIGTEDDLDKIIDGWFG